MKLLSIISNYSIPVIIGFIIIYGIIHKVNVYNCFIEGVKEGFSITFDILPTLVGLMLAVAIFRSSGLLDIICSIFVPIANLLKIPHSIIPVALVKMFSSSAATGMTIDIFKTYGPDSLAGNIISIMMSSTETIFYTISVYCVSIGITKSRWALPGALIASFAGIIMSIILGILMT